MSRDKLIILGVVVLGLLGFLVYQQTKKDESIGQPTVASKDFPTVSAPEDIDKISITNGDKGEVVLQKVAGPGVMVDADAGSDGVWELVKPVAAKANQQTAKDIVANLKKLKVESQINLKLDDDVKKDKNLDATHGVHVVAWKGADKKVDEIFGKSGPAGQLVMVADKPDKVWAISTKEDAYSAYLYTKEAKDYRDKDIFKFDDANVAQMTIVNSHGTLSFTKGDKWVGTLDKKPIPGFSEDKVKDMLKTYKALSADDFGDGKTLADTGLDKPDGTLSIVLKDGAGKYDLLLGKSATGANHWAKRPGDDAIFQLTATTSEWLSADGSKFAAAADAGAAAPEGGPKVSMKGKK
ncbi:MAG TPA: DUF4340 domain-containing protein [Polyangiaceae bacterium]